MSRAARPAPNPTPFTRAAAALCLLLAGPVLAQEPLKAAIEERVQAQEGAAASQQTIETLVTDTEAAVQEYRQATAQREDLAAYNDQLERLVQSQEAELAGFAGQMANAEATQTRLVPLLARMVETLEKFIALDVPFLPEERSQRVAALKATLDDAAVPLPEKYRRVMEAYQVETEYGRTIEAYRGDLAEGDATRAVEFLRVGRLALVYASLDGSETGYWDPGARAWKPLPADLEDEVLAGLQVARKEAPPDLIEVPVPPPGAAP